MKLRIAFSTLMLGSLLALPVLSSPLDDYNLFLTGDYNYRGGDVEGATFVGGDLKASGKSPTFATRTFANPVGLTVVGDLHAQNINVNNGRSVEYGGAYKVSHRINFNGGGMLARNEALSATAIADQLKQESQFYAGLEANGEYRNGVLRYAGDDDVAVFNLASSLLFARNTNLQLDYGQARTVIINVSGTDIHVDGGVNLQSGSFNSLGAANIVWNFSEASSIDFRNLGVIGAVLAMNADTRGGASFSGSFAAHSYSGDRAFRQFGFNSAMPGPTDNVVVTEPSLSLMFITGVLGLALLHRRRMRREQRRHSGQLSLPGF